MSGWVRRLTYYRDDLANPSFACAIRTRRGSRSLRLHMMATGAVTKPDGQHDDADHASTGTPFSIANGACFKFIGQWGVSWDVYYFGPSAEAFIGIWSHNWAPMLQQGQYFQPATIRRESIHLAHQDGGTVRRGGGPIPRPAAARLV